MLNERWGTRQADLCDKARSPGHIISVEAHPVPLSFGERASEDWVVRHFRLKPTDRACIILKNLFLFQDMTAFDAVLGQKPAEELDLPWRAVVINEFSGFGCIATVLD